MLREKQWREEIITTTGRRNVVPSRFHDGTTLFEICMFRV